MNPSHFRSALSRLGLSQSGAARLLGADPRTVRRWAHGDRAIPVVVAIIIELLDTGFLARDDLIEARNTDDARSDTQSP